MSLKEFDRCRVLFERWLEYDPLASAVWIQYAEFERALLDTARARALYELAIEQELDDPEAVWKAYIDWEASAEGDEGINRRNVVALYERLLERTGHLKVWVSYASYLAQLPDMPAARAVCERGLEMLDPLVTERIFLLEAWRELELTAADGDDANENVLAVTKRMPVAVSRIRVNEEGEEEPYVEYVFPKSAADEVEQEKPASAKLLAIAHQWKQGQVPNRQ
jgi:crooked neck